MIAMSEDDIEKKVLEILEESGNVCDGDSVDVIKVAATLGFAIGNAKMNDETEGFIVMDEEADEILGIRTNKLIGVNSKGSLEWKRFVVARQIANYVLNYSERKSKGLFACKDYAKGKNETESAADFFAAALLLPKDCFGNKYKELIGKGLEQKDVVVILSRRFIVTEETVTQRMEWLGFRNK